MSRALRALVIAGVVVAAACGAKDAPPPAKRTAEEQRAVDSTVGASRLPGAGGVQGALRVSDSAAARARELDSLSRLP
jgi:hypothetical protein